MIPLPLNHSKSLIVKVRNIAHRPLCKVNSITTFLFVQLLMFQLLRLSSSNSGGLNIYHLRGLNKTDGARRYVASAFIQSKPFLYFKSRIMQQRVAYLTPTGSSTNRMCYESLSTDIIPKQWAKLKNYSLKRKIMPASFGTSIKLSLASTSANNERDGNTLSNLRKEGKEHQIIVDDFLEALKYALSFQILPQIYLNSTEESPTEEGDVILIKNKDPLVILMGVSGGCDSIALFHSIMMLLNKRDPKSNLFGIDLSCNGEDDNGQLPCAIHVVHFDHGQRGLLSDGDRMLVKSLCQDYNVPFHCHYWQEDFQERNGKTITFSQESARDWRRSTSIQLLMKIIEQEGEGTHRGVIMTAHQKDDLEETILLKLLRGSYITNMSGMDIINEVKVDNAGRQRLYFAKPMLGLRKSDIKEFLSNQELQWREDASNASDKYMRNRVRNQLVPLLKDMVGGEGVLERRLENLQKQSKKLKEDLSHRTHKYFDSYNETAITNGYFMISFPLPKHENNLSLVEEHALHSWVKWRTDGGINLSYSKLMSLCHQVVNHPERRQWKVAVGSGWDIVRNGDVLDLIHNRGYDKNLLSFSSLKERTYEWILETSQGKKGGTSKLNTIEASFSISIDLQKIKESNKPVHFVLESVGGNHGLTFLPPWRLGKSPVKIKEFLRGQKIPLHRRDIAPIICVSNDSEKKIIAVYVENIHQSREDSFAEVNAGKWIVHSDFVGHSNEQIIVKQQQ